MKDNKYLISYLLVITYIIHNIYKVTSKLEMINFNFSK